MGEDAALTLLLLRHGDISGIDPPRFRGRADPPLSGRGERQARKLGGYIAAGWTIDALRASPRARCMATAACVAAATGRASQCWHLVDDIDYGDWTWLTHQEARTTAPSAFACWREHPELMRFKNGESLQDLLVRSADALRAIIEEFESGTIALMTHDSVIRALLLQLTGLPLSFYHRLTISPCSVSEVAFDKSAARLVRINETAHLR